MNISKSFYRLSIKSEAIIENFLQKLSEANRKQTEIYIKMLFDADETQSSLKAF